MTTDINTLAAELEAAKADLAQWERLTSAADRVKALTVSLEKARVSQAKADEAVAQAETDARLSRITDIRVTGSGGDNLLREQFTISWTAPVYDMYTMSAAPQQQRREGFQTLPDDVYECLVCRYPEQIPAAIMALAPGDPGRAMYEYLKARERGYIRKGKA